MATGFHIGKVIAPWRFLLFLALLAGATPLLIGPFGWGRGAMGGFDIAGTVFLLSMIPVFARGEADQMRDRAERNDANRILLLVTTVVVTLVILVAVANEIGQREQPGTVLLVIATLTLAWLFANVVYALHYAHLFYAREQEGKTKGQDKGGLNFPECDEPDYWDFVYFAFTLGMTFQTSDVDITSRQMRRVVVGHCLAAFVFNLGVLAFTINVLGGSSN